MSLIARYTRIEGTTYTAAKYGGENRNAKLSWKTLYNKMTKAKAFVSISPMENSSSSGVLACKSLCLPRATNNRFF